MSTGISISSWIVGSVRQVRLKASSLSNVTLGIAGLLTVQTILGLISPAYVRRTLALIPGITIRAPWTLLTSSFIESSLLGLVLSLAVLFLTANVAEAVYGPLEFAKLIAAAALSCGAVSFLLQYIMYIVVRRGSALFAETCGFTGVQGALLVAVKHVSPGQEVLVLPGVAVSTQYLPGLFILLCTLWSLVTADIGMLRFALVGTYAGWFYLRFIKVSGPEGMRGDPSADFALSTMCPQAAQPVLSVAFTAIAKVCGLHRTAPPPLPITQPTTGAATNRSARPGAGSGAGVEVDAQLDRDAARRREVGRQALEARLIAAGAAPIQLGAAVGNSTDAEHRVSETGSAASGPDLSEKE